MWDACCVPFALSVHYKLFWYLLYPYYSEYLSFCLIIPTSIYYLHLEVLLFSVMFLKTMLPQSRRITRGKKHIDESFVQIIVYVFLTTRVPVFPVCPVYSYLQLPRSSTNPDVGLEQPILYDTPVSRHAPGSVPEHIIHSSLFWHSFFLNGSFLCRCLMSFLPDFSITFIFLVDLFLYLVP